MNPLDKFLKKKLTTRVEEGNYRKLKIQEERIDFSSNDYLGFARSPELESLILSRQHNLISRNGSGGSRLLTGNSLLHEALEHKLAVFFKSESALLFNSGYAANLAVLSSIPQKNDRIIYDEYAHASIKDGARLSLAKRYTFKHNDLNDLEKKLKNTTGNQTFVVVESYYSMDGDRCPLTDLVKLCKPYNAIIVVDEAHSTGIVGEGGQGLVNHLKLENLIDIRIHTFGKALGVHGACIVGSKILSEYLINFARPFIYTTAPSPQQVLSIDCAFDFLLKNQNAIEILNAKISRFQQRYNTKYVNISPIQSIMIRGNEETCTIANHLAIRGFDVRPILSPTVQQGAERLRICIHTYNTDEEIDNLANTLKELLQDESFCDGHRN